MKAVVLTLLLCLMLVKANYAWKKKGWCSFNPKSCGKRAWESWRNMEQIIAAENNGLKNVEESKKAMKFSKDEFEKLY